MSEQFRYRERSRPPLSLILWAVGWTTLLVVLARWA
jgi:hypothetical protein